VAERQELDFGEAVLVSPDAPERCRPGSRGWVVALPLPNRDLLTVEFEDGTSVEISPDLVEKSEPA
jgi:hypothetical protein